MVSCAMSPGLQNMTEHTCYHRTLDPLCIPRLQVVKLVLRGSLSPWMERTGTC